MHETQLHLKNDENENEQAMGCPSEIIPMAKANISPSLYADEEVPTSEYTQLLLECRKDHSKATTASYTEQLRSLLHGIWSWYYSRLEDNPLLIKSATGFSIVFCSDLCAQLIEKWRWTAGTWTGFARCGLVILDSVVHLGVTTIFKPWITSFHHPMNHLADQHVSKCASINLFRLLSYYWLWYAASVWCSSIVYKRWSRLWNRTTLPACWQTGNFGYLLRSLIKLLSNRN